MQSLLKVYKDFTKQNQKPGSKLSLYVPTHPVSTPPNLAADRIRFKSMLQDLVASHKEAEPELLKTLNKLYYLQEDLSFWEHQGLSLAIFADDERYRTHQLPVELTAYSCLGERYMLLPLIMAQYFQSEAYLLSFSVNGGRLYAADMHQVQPIERVELPPIDDLLEEDQGDQQQFHSGAGPQSSAPKFHGQGGIKDRKEDDINLYMQLISQRLHKFLHGQSKPLILAGDDHRLTQFAAHLDYGHIIERRLTGNHEHATSAALATEARQVLMEQRLHEAAKQAERFGGAGGEGDRTATGEAGITAKLEIGAVDTLLVPCLRVTNDGVRSGFEGHVLLDFPESIDGLEQLATRTLEQGGNVVPVFLDSFSDKSPRAILRF